MYLESKERQRKANLFRNQKKLKKSLDKVNQTWYTKDKKKGKTGTSHKVKPKQKGLRPNARK